MDLGLEGKVVLVTGASDGLGRALCSTLVAEGARVAMLARDRDRLDAAAAELGSEGGDVAAVAGDVSVGADLDRLVEVASTRWGRIDGVVNNAGRSAARPVVDLDDAEWDEDLHLKLHAAAGLARRSLPSLGVQGGSVVNVLALAAKAPGASSAPSSVSRAAGMALTKVLSKELGPAGVRVNAVLVGLVESGQWRRMSERTGTPLAELYAKMASDAAIPLGRVGRASEFADLVTYLLSARSSYVTGTAVNLDGGSSPVV